MFGGIIAAYKRCKDAKFDPVNPSLLLVPPYKIKAAVDKFGTPTYELRSVYFDGFACYFEKVIATNTDRAVLERAMEHLQSK